MAWKAARLDGRPEVLQVPRPHECPFIAWHAGQGWFIVTSHNADGSWLAQDAKGATVRLNNLDGAECVSLPAKVARAASVPKASHLIWGAIWQRKAIVFEALLATVLVNTLAIVASIFSMQVYDRVIPNQGFQTLWVLTIGVLVALVLEFVIKHVRGHAIERTSMRIDAELSEWFFERALGIRLECRPPSVGTLAAQIKGFEMVRGIMSSTSIFMLVDVPFAVFFIVIIGLIAPQLVIVPIVMLPISLITGLMFQRQIASNSKLNQGQSNRKAGLLVESIDGAESLKANSAEWKLQARWNQLVAESGATDYNIKQFSSLSQTPDGIAATGGLCRAGRVWRVSGYRKPSDHGRTDRLHHHQRPGPVADRPATRLMVQWSRRRRHRWPRQTYFAA